MINSIKKFTLGLFACLTLISVNACGDDDNEKDPIPEKITANVSYAYSCQPDLLLAIDITVTYVNAEGKEVSETVSEQEWEKELTNVTVPFTAKLTITYAKKEGFVPTKDTYMVGEGKSIGYKTSDNKLGGGSLSIASKSIRKDRINQYLEKLLTRENTTSTEEIK